MEKSLAETGLVKVEVGLGVHHHQHSAFDFVGRKLGILEMAQDFVDSLRGQGFFLGGYHLVQDEGLQLGGVGRAGVVA
jgi:hypothetical protein